MDSRYALREIECAIGYDCRRLDDGRTAVFYHTPIHRRIRRDFLERRDFMSVMQCSMISAAAILSHHKIDVNSAIGSIDGRRASILKIAFPYLKFDVHDDNEPKSYDVYFDELDEIIKSENSSQAGSENDTASLPGKVEMV